MAIKPVKVIVTVTKGPSAGPAQTFHSHTLTVGRGAENSVVLGKDPKASRNHVELQISAGGIFVRNLSGKNPIAVNGEVVQDKLVTGQVTLLVGESEIIFERPDAPKEMHPQAEPPSQALKIVPNTGFAPQMPPPHGPPVGFSQATLSSQEYSSGPSFHTAPTPPAANPIADVLKNPKARFYIIIGIVGLVVVGLFSGSGKKKKPELKLRDSVQSNEDYVKSEAEVKRMRDDPRFKAKDSIQYQMADQHFTRGFRDYRNGQYGRAMEGFQAALSFYPAHELARKYYGLAARKFDQMVQMHMVLGRRYYGKGNHRLCMSEFRNVIIMKKDPRDAVRKEALQYYEECRLRSEEGR